MLLDKLPWCRHGDGQIFSLDVQPGGLRFATCGNDCNVKIWSLPAALDARQENAANPKLLATLSDHTSPVDVVRFSPSGTQLASGSDDAVVCIYDLRPGAGAGVLGGESNVENWRTRHTLRGHATHVVDLCWSPDGSRLATASLDRTVAIWDTTKGAKIATIDAHGSFVKGVAWDPVGTYLATQSEDKSVAIWRTDDWSLVGRVTSPFKQMITSTFSCRLAWSPDGCFLLAGNSYQGATHAAVLVPREKWQNVDEYLYISGHAGAVTATAFSPKLRHLPPLGGGKPEGDNLSAVFAVGGQDRRITVWAAGRPRPILILSKLFGNSVQDVRWTPDGRTLLAASLEGYVACVQFGEEELGSAASSEEFADVMKQLYGAAGGRPGKRVFAESAEQLDLEENPDPKSPLAPRAALTTVTPQQAAAPAGPSTANGVPKDPLAALDARLGGRMAAGAVTQTGFGGGPAAEGAAAPAARKGIVARRADAELMPPPPSAGKPLVPAAKRLAVETVQPSRGAGSRAAPQSAVVLSAPEPRATIRVMLGTTTPLIGSGSIPHELHVANKPGAGGTSVAEVCLMHGDQPAWNDALPSAVIAATGTTAFSAVATADGHLIMYTPAGRRKAPPLRLGAGIALLVAGCGSLVLTATTTGTLTVLDADSLQQVMQVQLAPLLEGGAGLLDIRLSRSGVPLVTLNDATAYIWHQGLKAWARVADDSFAVSRYAPVLQLPGQGEVSALQAAALASGTGAGAPPLLGSGAAGTAAKSHFSRGHAEASLAAAEALGSLEDYKAWLATYSRGLADAADEGRLRELCDSLLGPVGDGAGVWEPLVLGVRKRQLLREVVLREVARNRVLGGLLQRCRLALDDIEGSEAG